MRAALGADSSIRRKFQECKGRLSPPLRDWIDLRKRSMPPVITSPSGGYSCSSGYHPSFMESSPCLPHLSVLEGIKDELQSLSERFSAAGYQENDADRRAVCELAEDLRDAVIEYQVGPDPSTVHNIPVEAVHSSPNRGKYTTRTVD